MKNKKSSTYNSLFVIDTTAAKGLPKPISGEINEINLSNYIRMMNDNPNNPQVQEGNELIYNCKLNDIILWRGTSINQDDTVNIINFTSGTNPSFKIEKMGNYFRGYVIKHSYESYRIKFMINSDTSRIYFWDVNINCKRLT